MRRKLVENSIVEITKKEVPHENQLRFKKSLISFLFFIISHDMNSNNQHLTFDRKEFLDLLKLATHFNNKRWWLPILSSVMLIIKDNRLTIKSTDMNAVFTCKIDEDSGIHDDASIGVITKDLIKVVTAMKHPTISIHIEKINNDMFLYILDTIDGFESVGEVAGMKVFVGKTKNLITMTGLWLEEFVATPTIEEWDMIDISRQLLIDWIKTTKDSILEKNFSPIFTGLYIHTTSKSRWQYLNFCGTDSYRLAHYKDKLEKNVTPFEINIPKTYLSPILTTLELSNAHVASFILQPQKYEYKKIWGKKEKIKSTNTRRLNIQIPHKRYFLNIQVALISWNFPNYDNDKIIPHYHKSQIEIPRTDLLECCRIATNTKCEAIELNMKDHSLTIDWKYWNEKYLWVLEKRTPLIGDPQTIGLNLKHLTPFLMKNKNATVRLKCEWDKPMIRVGDNLKLKYVIRPVKY